MKKCQTVKDMSIEDNKTEREANYTHRVQKINISNKKASIPFQQLNLSNKIILTNKKYPKRKNITNILTNDNNTISNINISLNSNNLPVDSSNSYRSKIYQKKRIPFPHRNFSKEKEKKSFNILMKNKLNIESIRKNNNDNISNINFNKKVGSEGKTGNLTQENICNLEQDIYYKNNSIKNNSNSLNNDMNKIKKYLYLSNNIKVNRNNNRVNTSYKNRDISEKNAKKTKKRINSQKNKKIDMFKINKIKNINNININLNNINNITNKIEYGELVKNVKNCETNKGNNDIKKINFDQPRKHNFHFNTYLNNNESSDKTFNYYIEIPGKIKRSQSPNYNISNDHNMNLYTANNNSGIINNIKTHLINPKILTIRNNPYPKIINTENKIENSHYNNSAQYLYEKSYKNKREKKIKSKNENKETPKSLIPYRLDSNKKNNIKALQLFSRSKEHINNIKDRFNIFVNKESNNLSTRNKSRNTDYDKNLVSNDSLTILNYSNSEITSFVSNNDLTQVEYEKEENNKVLSTYQLNIILKEAKKLNSKNVNGFNNIPNIPIHKKNLLYIEKSNKYHTNKSIEKINNMNEIRSISNDNYVYNSISRTHHPKLKKLYLNNILFLSINTNFKILLLKFIDKKSLLVLSSLNKTFYKNLRKKIYKYFYDIIIKNNDNKDYILKILNSIPKYASDILKSNNQKILKAKYEYYKKIKSIYNDIILQDIIRTFPNEQSFKANSVNYYKLYNLLISYSNYNKSIGYAQGLNFLAASSIFLFKNEEKIFIFLDGLINRFKLNNLLSIKNQNLPKKLKYFSDILNKYCSKFINYLSSKLLSHEFFSTGWILTLFSNSMDRSKLFIFWTFMIIFGWKFFYSFVVQLLLFYEKNLLETNEAKLSIKMKEMLKKKEFIKDFNKIVECTLTFMSNNIVL